jgi:hypothetical protein
MKRTAFACCAAIPPLGLVVSRREGNRLGCGRAVRIAGIRELG